METQAGGSRFFRGILERFNLKQILLMRLVVDLLAFGILGYLTHQFLIELTPSFAVPREFVILLFSGALSGFACKEYYAALKPLAVKKSTITTQNKEKALDTLNNSKRHRAQAIEYKKLATIF